MSIHAIWEASYSVGLSKGRATAITENIKILQDLTIQTNLLGCTSYNISVCFTSYSRLCIIPFPIISSSLLFKEFLLHGKNSLASSYKWLRIIGTSIFWTLPHFERSFLSLDVFSLLTSNSKIVLLELPWGKVVYAGS